MIVHHGLKEMYTENRNVFYYLTLMNENYPQPSIPDGVEEGIIRGMYLLKPRAKKGRKFVRLLGSGTILREVEAAAELLVEFGVDAEIWSVTSFNELSRDGQDVARWNMLHPDDPPRQSFVASALGDGDAPVVAATDYMKNYAEQIRAFVAAPYRVLGTDGFGRSDSRKQLRRFFEVDRESITVAALSSLAEGQIVAGSVVKEAIERFKIDADRPPPRLA